MKLCRNLILLYLLLIISISVVNAQYLLKDSLSYELRYFVKLLEETHPDPYTEFGGKVKFHKEIFDLEQKIETDNITLKEYTALLSSLLSGLHDGHSYLNSDSKTESSGKYIPISLRVISDGLLIEKISFQYKEYLGARLTAINNISIDSLCVLISRIIPCENKYSRYNALRMMTHNTSHIYKLFPDLKDHISLTVLTQDDEEKKFNLELSENKISDIQERVEYPKWKKEPLGDYLYFDYLDNEGKTMYMKVGSIMSRECFLYMKENNWTGFENMLTNLYKRILYKELPDDRDKAIADIPSFSEIFKSMLCEMSENKSENLIIDLRKNGGGFTDITLPSLYMLYGDKYLNTDMNNVFYRLISPLLMEKYGTTLSKYNESNNSNYRFGDYTFFTKKKEEKTIQQKRDIFVSNAMGGAGVFIKELNGQPVYIPKHVYVLTDVQTFSAAFHYAFYLWKMGAIIVGVPSSQAPNTYMEVTPFELPYTKVKGSISNSVQYFLPVADKRAKIFWPDMMPEYKDYKKYNFDQDAELLWLLDRINNK